VNDNCSEDGTAEYLEAMAATYSSLSFGVNRETVPIDENLFLPMWRGDERYVYPLGDDDFLPDGALASIVAALSSEPDVLILSAVLADFRLNPKRHLIPDELRGETFDDPQRAFRLLWDKMPFGSFVMRREIVDADAFRKYNGTYHAYTGVVWEWLARKYAGGGRASVRCMEGPSVILRGGRVKSWQEYKACVYLYGIPAWFRLLPRVYAEETVPIMKEYLRAQGSLVSLLAYRRSGQLTPANCGEFMTYFGETDRRRAAVVSRIPPVVAGVLRFFVKRWAS
jgi:hypothetical protein